MLCQNCSKAQATTHIKRIINGEATEQHLCAACAKKLGFDSFFDDFSLSSRTQNRTVRNLRQLV